MSSSSMVLILLCLHCIMGYDDEICETSICEYTWEIRRFSTMTYYDGTASYDVTLNGTQLVVSANSHTMMGNSIIGTALSSDDVITGDGYKRNLITINDKFPGPNLHVMSGAQIVVHVWNRMSLESTTVHWHGIHQQDTPWMDGVPYITQCPIQPSQKFTYRFIASQSGTRWYHAHLVSQHIYGLFGMLIIHPAVPSTPEFIFTINDWLHTDAISYEFQNSNKMVKPGTGNLLEMEHMSMVKFFGALINGRGRWNDEKYPLEKFKVTQGQTYRFRVASAGLEYSFKISIDQHRLNIVALDGVDINPIEVDSFIIHTGETLDFMVTMNHAPDQYWLRSAIIKASLGKNPDVDDPTLGVNAVLVYDNIPTTGDPQSSPIMCTSDMPCHVFNCPYPALPISQNITCINIEQATNPADSFYLVKEYSLDKADDDIVEYFYNFGFAVGSSINSRRFVMSRAPLYRADVDEYLTECVDEVCDTEGCWCTFIEEIPLNKTIQIVMTNLSPEMGQSGDMMMMHNDHAQEGGRVKRTDHNGHMHEEDHKGMTRHHHTHPHIIHLHGHSMAVVAVGYPVYNMTTGHWMHDNQEIECYGDSPELCTKIRFSGNRPELNRVNPVIKNTVLVPPGGYAIVRFNTMNPGFWFLHCHMEQHLLDGMAMIFNEGPGVHPPLPTNFPDCHDFTWSEQQHKVYAAAARDMRFMSMTETTGTNTSEDTTTKYPEPWPFASDDDEPGGIRITYSMAVGASFGLLLLGATLPLLAMGTYYRFFMARREWKEVSTTDEYEGMNERAPILLPTG